MSRPPLATFEEPMESLAQSFEEHAVTAQADWLLRRLVQGKVTLPVLPAAAQKVIGLASDEDASMRDIVDAMKADQSLTSYVLKVANSPLFAPISPIVSVQQACTRLGSKQLRDLALMVSMSATFKVDGWERELAGLFRHAVVSAFFAAEIARKRRLNVEEAFLAGLLADVGMSAALPMAVNAKLDRTRTLVVVDRVHTEFGAMLVKGWALPRSIELVAKYHHTSDRPEVLVQVVQLADVLTQVVIDGAERTRVDAHPAIEALMLYPEDIDALLELAPRAIEAAGAFS